MESKAKVDDSTREDHQNKNITCLVGKEKKVKNLLISHTHDLLLIISTVFPGNGMSSIV